MKIFCTVLLVWFCLDDATRCFKEGHMATGPALHVVIVTNLTMALPGHAAGATRLVPMPRYPCLQKGPSHSTLPLSLSRALPPSLCLCRAKRHSTGCAATTMATVIPTFPDASCLASTTIASASLPSVPRVCSPEPASPGATVTPARAAAALHACGQAAMPYSGMSGTSHGCTMNIRCRAGHPRRATTTAARPAVIRHRHGKRCNRAVPLPWPRVATLPGATSGQNTPHPVEHGATVPSLSHHLISSEPSRAKSTLAGRPHYALCSVEKVRMEECK
jgi:hypothetical protein